MTQCLFLKFSELQLWEDGVSTTSRHRDAVDVAVRESTGLTRAVSRHSFLDTGGGVPNRYAYAAGLDLDKVRTVILNPSAVDTAGPQLETLKADAPVPLTLQIRFAAADGDGGIPVIGGNAVVDVAAAARVKQVRPGSRVLPFSDVLWLSAEDA